MQTPELLVLFFNHQIKIKMFHFHTTKYGHHKASDDYLEKFNTNFDRFMEVYFGLHPEQRNVNNLVFSNISTPNDAGIITYLSGFEQVLSQGINVHSKLKVIIDEMVADINQFKYLLKLE